MNVPDHHRMPSCRTPIIAVALAAVMPLAACASSEQGAPKGDPVKVVRDFLIDGPVDQNGYEACVYLTTREQRAAAWRSAGPECRQAFDLAAFRLGGHTIDTVHEVEGLPATASVYGDRAAVQVTGDGGSARFVLVKATRAEQEQFLAPDTEWRIADGGLRVIPPKRL